MFMSQLQGGGTFFFDRGTAKCQLEKPTDCARLVTAGIVAHSLREGLRHVEREAMVQERERLQRAGRHGPDGRG